MSVDTEQTRLASGKHRLTHLGYRLYRNRTARGVPRGAMNKEPGQLARLAKT